MAPSTAHVSKPKFDLSAIETFLNIITLDSSEVREIRAPKCGKLGTISGYFRDRQKFIAALRDLSGDVPNVYITLNPVSSALLSRCNNRWQAYSIANTEDVDVVGRKWLLVDIDPQRPTGISSTDAEKALALQMVLQVREYLTAAGWAEPILADSGNGYHLLYRIDLPNDIASKDLVKGVLDALAGLFDNNAACVDTSVHNASRIFKAYGTKACKGDDTEERPHRIAAMLEIPVERLPVRVEQLQGIADLAPKPTKKKSKVNAEDGGWDEDCALALLAHGAIIPKAGVPYKAGIKYQHDCLRNPDHRCPDAFTILENGWLTHYCSHNSCGEGLNTSQLVELIEQIAGTPFPGKPNRRKTTVEDFSFMGVEDAATQGAPAEPPEVAVDPLAFPEECMYGELGTLARGTRMPLGLAYPAVIGCYTIKPDADMMCDTRINEYVCLIADVGGGKNEAIRRSRESLGLRKGEEWIAAAPSGARNLMTLLGDKPAGKGKKEMVAGLKKALMLTNEMSDVLKPAALDNSNLSSRLCDFWDENYFVLPTRERNITADCRLSWVGGVPATAEKPDRFTTLFNEETSHGLYDRLILGYSSVKFNYRKWTAPSHEGETILAGSDYCTAVTPVRYVHTVSDEAMALFEAWEPVGGGSRIKYNCMKVAILTTLGNNEDTVTLQCMKCAARFMEWQIALRNVFKPGEGINSAAEFRTKALRAIERRGGARKFVNWTRIAHDNKWGDRFGDWIMNAGIANLVKSRELIYQVITPASDDEPEVKDDRMVMLSPEMSGDF